MSFNDERVAAESLAREARAAERDANPAALIAAWSQLINEHPIDAALVTEAEAGRAKALSAGLAEVAAVRDDVERARFFRLLDLFRQCRERALATATNTPAAKSKPARAWRKTSTRTSSLARDLDRLEACTGRSTPRSRPQGAWPESRRGLSPPGRRSAALVAAQNSGQVDGAHGHRGRHRRARQVPARRLQGQHLPHLGVLSRAAPRTSPARGRRRQATNARIGLTGRDVNLRYTRVPRVPDWQLRKLMRFEVEEIGDQSGSEVASDFNLLPEMAEIDGEDVVVLAMARESLLEGHWKGWRLGGKLDALSPNAGLSTTPGRYGVIEDDTILLANIGHENVDVILVRGADLLFARNLSGGSK
jgi:hypothetical protein